ncbi:MAG: NTP transferase domain-containing protein [Planctomycetes bacterium]|nr:NTP transferase domain-containing protein [Planctomycetota bacterium]MCB9910647.1 NTP transferase domain-containing protein [Planctomycetota bacterium]HPF15633.1 sugar phosphate nucleotidyltransferase [Planctomycetota bacterium]
MSPVRKAVVLAAGAGKRMRLAQDRTPLTDAQAAAAGMGAKAMMPLGERPFLDHVLHALADAGIKQVGLVLAPEHQAVRAHYEALAPRRITIDYLVQATPRGTADALLAAEAFTLEERFLVLNGDNYYPPPVLARLAQCDAPALAAFSAQSLLEGEWSDSDRDARLRAFADVRFDATGWLVGLEEKPAHTPTWISMNAWCLGPEIYRACRAIEPSPRGEWELPSAVSHSQQVLGVRYAVLPCRGPVLDLSQRGDIGRVQAALAHRVVDL